MTAGELIKNHIKPKMLQIVSAWYGPNVGRRWKDASSLSLSSSLSTPSPETTEAIATTGDLEDESTHLPFADTRQVTNFVRSLLLLQYQRDAAQLLLHQGETRFETSGPEASEKEKCSNNKLATAQDNEMDQRQAEYNGRTVANENSGWMVRIDAFRTKSGMKRTIIPLMEGKSMNEAFGDPCPGTSKRLEIHYQVFEFRPRRNVDVATVKTSVCKDDDGVKRKLRLAKDCHESFAEHERVILRLPAYGMGLDENSNEQVLSTFVDSLSPISSPTLANHPDYEPSKAARDSQQDVHMTSAAEEDVSRQQHLQLPLGVWELVLPMILLFLEIRERVTGRLVNRMWQKVVRDWGVAQSIDWTDEDEFPNNTFTCAVLRGLLRHSYFSLTNLYLANLKELTHQDLAPAIPHWRRLRSLDVSGCYHLNDTTLQLLAQHVSNTLQVLYVKSLCNVTDQGIVAICKSCHRLRVLDISNLRALTDEGAGLAIGENLTQLRALYLRDNYLLTNQSIDVITEKCTQLTQLTLWGCIKLEHLSFEQQPDQMCCGNLVVLNLWGCHNLRNDSASALGKIKQLRSLIVSECHRLTDQFLIGLTQNTPQLNHLHLRYCKKVTDNGVSAIAAGMSNLVSLDLSFCTRISMASIVSMLEMRRDTLSELRLQSCHQLTIGRRRFHGRGVEGDASGALDGQKLVIGLRGHNSRLDLLDLRGCGGHHNINEPYAPTDSFVREMEGLRFKQKVPGFFTRPAPWDPALQLRLCDLLMDETPQELEDVY